MDFMKMLCMRTLYFKRQVWPQAAIFLSQIFTYNTLNPHQKTYISLKTYILDKEAYRPELKHYLLILNRIFNLIKELESP